MDLNIIIQQLQECDTFNWQSKTQYASFITLKKNVVQTLDEKKVKEWMIVHFKKL